jgi:ankyrin repeat protein
MYTTRYHEALNTIFNDKFHDQNKPSNPPSDNIKKALELWNDEGNTLRPEDWMERVNKTMSLISTEFSQQQGENFKPYQNNFADNSPFAENMKGHLRNGAITPVQNVMRTFGKYAEILIHHSVEKQQEFMNAFPPSSSSEIACTGGTNARIEELISFLTCNYATRPIEVAQTLETAWIVDKLKFTVPSGNEVHIPSYMNYALGLIPPGVAKQADQFYLTPESDIPMDTMWGIVTEYPINMKVKVSKAIRTEADEQYEKIAKVIKETQDPSNLTSDQLTELNKLMQTYSGGECADLLEAKEVDDDDDSYVWLTEKSLRQKLYDNHPTHQLLKTTDEYEVNISEDINTLSYPNILFSEKAQEPLLRLLKSQTISDRVFAVEALWVMSKNFRGEYPATFIPLLDNIISSIDNKDSASLDTIANSIPEQFRFKVEGIKDRYEHYNNQANIRSYIQNSKRAHLRMHLKYGATADTIINRIATHPQEIIELTDNDAKKLISHPCKREILEKINSAEVKGFLHKYNLSLQDNFIQQAIYCGVTDNDEETVQHFLNNYITDENKAKILNEGLQHDSNNIPIIVAARNGQENIITALLKSGASPDTKDNNNCTPMMIAAQNGNAEVITALGAARANPNIKLPNGATAMHIAAENGHAKAITALSKAGADPNVKLPNGLTAMHIAAGNGHAKAITALSKAGVDPNVKLPNGTTAMHIAARYGFPDAIKILAEVGVDPNIKGQDGTTAMHIAAHYGFPDAIKILAEVGADPNLKDNAGMTAMIDAAYNCDTASIDALIQTGASLLVKNETCFSVTCLSVLRKMYQKMPAGESKVALRDDIERLTVLKNTHKLWEKHFTEKNIKEVLKLIDNSNLNKNWADTNGQTAAHLYLSTTKPSNFDKDIFNNLVTNVNLTKKNYAGHDLLQTALNKGHTDLANDLIKELTQQGKFEKDKYKFPAPAKATLSLCKDWTRNDKIAPDPTPANYNARPSHQIR